MSVFLFGFVLVSSLYILGTNFDFDAANIFSWSFFKLWYLFVIQVFLYFENLLIIFLTSFVFKKNLSGV